MPPYDDAAAPVVPNQPAKLYEPDHNSPVFRGEIRQPAGPDVIADGGSCRDRLACDVTDQRTRVTINDHRQRGRFEDPRAMTYGALQTENQFGFEFAKPKYMAAIAAADRISQRNVFNDRCCACSRMQGIDLTLARGADGCCRNSRCRRMSPCAEQQLRGQRTACLQDEDRLWGCYLAPGSTRVQAGMRFIANGQTAEGEKLVAKGLELRPEIGRDPNFIKMLEQARAQGRALERPPVPQPPAPGPDVRRPPQPVRASAGDFYNFHGSPAGSPTDTRRPPQFGAVPPPDVSPNLPRVPAVDRTGGPAPARTIDESNKVYPYSATELHRREKQTMEYVAKMAPTFRFAPRPDLIRQVLGPDVAPPQRTLPNPQFPPIEPPPPVRVEPPAPTTNTNDGFTPPAPETPAGGKNFWETVKDYSKEDWVRGLAAILAALGVSKGIEIYRNLGKDVVRQHVENGEQVKVTVDATKTAGERGVKAFDKITGQPLEKLSADGKYYEATRADGTIEKIPVQNIDRIRYEIVAADQREVKQLKAELELRLKGLPDRAAMISKLDVQHDAAMTEKQKFVFTDKGVEVGTIEGINQDGTIKVKQADGSFVNRTVNADTQMVLKFKDAVANVQKLNGADVAEFMKLASPQVNLSDWTRMQGEVREQKTREFEDALNKLLEDSKKAHEETKQKLEEAKKALADQEKLNETERKKYTTEIDGLQKQLEKATEAVSKAEERIKTEAAQREAAVKTYQETKTKLETAQKDLAALAETDKEKRAELDKQIKQLQGDLTKNSQSLDEVNKKLAQQIVETEKSREKAAELQKSLADVQQKLQTESQRVQTLEQGLAERDAQVKALTEANRVAAERAAEAEKQRVAREAEMVKIKTDLDAARKELDGKTGTEADLVDAKAKLAELSAKYEEATKAAKEFERQLAAEQKERTTVTDELKVAQEKLTKAQADFAVLKDKTAADQKKLEQVEGELKTKITELETKLKASDTRVETQAREQTRLATELSTARTQLQDAQVKMGGDAARIAELQKQLDARDAQLKQAEQAKQQAETRAAEAEKERTAREKELADIKAELDAAKTQIEKKTGTEADLAAANTKLKALQDKYDAAEKARGEFETKLKDEQTERTKQADAVKQLQADLAKAQADLREAATKSGDEKAALEKTAGETATRLQAQLDEATKKLTESEGRVTKAIEEQKRIGTELQTARAELTEATGKLQTEAATIEGLKRQLEAAKKTADANETAKQQAEERAKQEETQRKAAETKVADLERAIKEAETKLSKADTTKADAIAEVKGQLAALQTRYEAAKLELNLATTKAQEEATAREAAVKQATEASKTVTELQGKLAEAEKGGAAERTRLQTELTQAQAQVDQAQEALKQLDERLRTQTRAGEELAARLTAAETALKDALKRLGDAPAPTTPPSPGSGRAVTGKPISSGGDNYRPIAREGDTVTLLNIDKIPEGREQSRTKAEIEAQFDRKRLNIDGTEREYLVEKAKTDGRPQRVYQLVSEATDASAGKVKLVGETYVKKTSDKAGNSGQTYAEWLADYDAKKGTTEVTERMRPGVQGNVGTTAGDGGVKPTGGTGTTGDGTVKPAGDGTGGTGAVTPAPVVADGVSVAQVEALLEVNNRLTAAPGEAASADVRAAIDDAIAQHEADPAKKAMVEALNKMKTGYATEAKAINESLARTRATVTPTASTGGTPGPATPLPELAFDRTNVSGGNVTSEQHTTGAGERTAEKLTQEDVKALEAQKVANQTRLKAIETELADKGLDTTKRTQLEAEQRRLIAENANMDRAQTDPVFGGRVKAIARIAGPVGAVAAIVIAVRLSMPETKPSGSMGHQRYGGT